MGNSTGPCFTGHLYKITKTPESDSLSKISHFLQKSFIEITNGFAWFMNHLLGTVISHLVEFHPISPSSQNFKVRGGNRPKKNTFLGYVTFKGCFNTPLEHTPKPLPKAYKGISFIIGLGDCLGCALGVCWNNLWYIPSDKLRWLRINQGTHLQWRNIVTTQVHA